MRWKNTCCKPRKKEKMQTENQKINNKHNPRLFYRENARLTHAKNDYKHTLQLQNGKLKQQIMQLKHKECKCK